MIKRGLAGIGLAIGIGLMGASGAYAWTWAPSSNPITMNGGGGYGNLNPSTLTSVVLQSWLRDTKVGDGRVYAFVVVKATGYDYTQFSSGRRSDGESSYAKMADTTKSGITPSVGSYHYQVSTCRSVTLNDPCSTDKRTVN